MRADIQDYIRQRRLLDIGEDTNPYLPTPGSSSNPSSSRGLPLPSYNEDEPENQLAVYKHPSSTGNSYHDALPDIYTVPGAGDLTASALVIFLS